MDNTTRRITRILLKLAFSLGGLAASIFLFLLPMAHYNADCKTITSGVIQSKYISHGFLGLGSASYQITVNAEYANEIRVPWFLPDSAASRTFYVTATEYESLHVGDYFRQ